jgi:hypothetical protein
MLDLGAIDRAVIGRAKISFSVNVRAFDAIHVATAEVLAAEAGGEPLESWTHDERIDDLDRDSRTAQALHHRESHSDGDASSTASARTRTHHPRPGAAAN